MRILVVLFMVASLVASCTPATQKGMACPSNTQCCCKTINASDWCRTRLGARRTGPFRSSCRSRPSLRGLGAGSLPALNGCFPGGPPAISSRGS